MTNEDRAMLIRAVEGVSEIRTNVSWLKDAMVDHKAELREQRSEIDQIRRKVYYLFGGLGAFELLSHIKNIFKI
jgi:hypothetical protein